MRVAVQRALADHRRSQGFAPQVRIGVHSAEATRHGHDYSGGEVHKAARIAAAAGGGEILATAETVAPPTSAFTVGEPQAVALKGIAEPVSIVTIDWRLAREQPASGAG